MKKAAYIVRCILVFIIMLLVQFGSLVLICVLNSILTGQGVNIADILSSSIKGAYDPSLRVYIFLAFAIIGIIVFGSWYRYRFIAPFKGMQRNYQSGFTLLTILTLVIAAFGIQFVGDAIVSIMGRIAPAVSANYQEMIAATGIGQGFSPLMLLYVVVLGPIMEELVFRGLIYRFARLALPFWGANILQAALFAVYHGNIVQGIYAFIFGIVLGYIAHRGHGIRYSLFTHIAINALGWFFIGFFDTVTGSFTGLSILIGIILIIFSMFAFSVEFHPLHKTKPVGQRPE
jgi:membrane protease YdiL (CAAX protease family)